MIQGIKMKIFSNTLKYFQKTLKYFHLGVDGVVVPGDPRDGGLEHGQGVGGVAGGGVQVAVAWLGVGVQGGLLLLPSLTVGAVVAAVTSQGVATHSQSEG